LSLCVRDISNFYLKYLAFMSKSLTPGRTDRRDFWRLNLRISFSAKNVLQLIARI
jgi:hypothetical protein